MKKLTSKGPKMHRYFGWPIVHSPKGYYHIKGKEHPKAVSLSVLKLIIRSWQQGWKYPKIGDGMLTHKGIHRKRK